MFFEDASVAVLLVGIRLLIAGVLFRAALGKARAPEGAVEAVSLLLKQKNLRLASVIVWCVVSAEAFAGFALLTGFAVNVAAGAVVVMMIGFSLTWVALRRFGAEGCSCFGEGTSARPAVVARNSLLAIGAAAILAVSARVPAAEFNLPAWRVAPEHLLWGIVLAIWGWLSWSLLTMLNAILRGAETES
jgi:uncharacterized membrane protein YphA (DoxX/SURF4 family)